MRKLALGGVTLSLVLAACGTTPSQPRTVAQAGSVTATARTPAPAPGNYIGYFTQWGIYGANFKVKDVVDSGAAQALTHINYAFGNVTESGECASFDTWADWDKPFNADETVSGEADTWAQPLRGNFNQLKQLKAKYPALRTLISLGGWTGSKYFSNAALDGESRKKLVRSCIDLFIKGNLPVANGTGVAAGVFDGIDIDWEYPAAEGNPGNVIRPEDTKNFTLLLAEFRRQLCALERETGKHYLLTAALPAGPAQAAKLEIGKIARSLDFINLMTYDFHGAWDPTTNFHSNLFASPNDPSPVKLSVESAVQFYLDGGMPARKINVGVPFYGRGWTGVAGDNNGLYQSATGAAQGTAVAGSDNYNVLVNAPGNVFRDAATKQLWKFDGTNFWTYDDAQVIADKAAFIKSRGLGGAMAWSLDGDDRQATLSKAIRQGLR